jgi:DNA-directed RNA polymerase subunit RPC12/RpoP
MKNNINIPIPKKEDLDALNKRRENYAASRDLQASEFNQAISKRLQTEAMNIIKCSECGKEFASGNTSDASLICPDCLEKTIDLEPPVNP